MINYSILAGVAILTLINYRIILVREYRMKLISEVRNDPQAVELLLQYLPPVWRMVLSLKRVSDRAWLPAVVRALRQAAKLTPDDRNKLIKFLNTQPGDKAMKEKIEHALRSMDSPTPSGSEASI